MNCPTASGYCCACGDELGFCQGHTDDPRGWATLQDHASGDHTYCSLEGP